MPLFTIEIPNLAGTEARLKAAPEAVSTTLEDAVRAATIIMQSIAKLNAPVRTGRLRKSIDMEVEGLRGTVYPDLKTTPYGWYVHQGTGLYGQYHTRIVPKNKQVLATKVNPGWGSANSSGYFIIGKSTAGQKANPFMKRAYEQGRVKVLAIMKDAVDLAMKEV